MSSRHPFLTRLVAALLAAGALAACGDGTPDEMTSSTMADEMTSTSVGG